MINKKAVDMTPDELAEELALRWNELVFFEPTAPSKSNRTYANRKRGGNFFPKPESTDFYGKTRAIMRRT